MRETFLNSKDDIEWLFSTHLKSRPELKNKTRSFMLYGNEDSPEKVVLFSRKMPKHDDNGFFALSFGKLPYRENPADKSERGTFIEIRGIKTGKLYLILNASIGTMRELRMTAQRIADKYKEQVSVKRVTKVKKNPVAHLARAARGTLPGQRAMKALRKRRVIRVKKNPSEVLGGKSIETKYAPATNTKGAKIRAYVVDGNRYLKTIVIPYPMEDDEYAAHLLAAEMLRDKMGWKGDLIGVGTRTGYVFGFREIVRFKKNPIEPAAEIADAKNLFESFTGHEASTARRVKTPAARVALAIGPLLGVAYETTRDGKREKYFHEFRSSARPLLAASSDGRSLFMLGGAYRFTDRGIVDSPKKRSR